MHSDHTDLDRIARCIQLRDELAKLQIQKIHDIIEVDDHLLRYKRLVNQLDQIRNPVNS
jgi:hypothetical protein